MMEKERMMDRLFEIREELAKQDEQREKLMIEVASLRRKLGV